MRFLYPSLVAFLFVSVKQGSISDQAQSIPDNIKSSNNYEFLAVAVAIFEVDGDWSPWSAWSACPPVLWGLKSRTRSCTDPAPSSGGSDCFGLDLEARGCTGNIFKFHPWKRKSNLMITVRYIAMVSAETTCPSPMPADWSQVASTGKFYKIVLESLSWYDARQTCLDAGMDMFNTETREEADLVRHHGGYICCKSILSWR